MHGLRDHDHKRILQYLLLTEPAMLKVSQRLDSNDLNANLPQKQCDGCAGYKGPKHYRTTCTPESLPPNGKSLPKCSNCRDRRTTCSWGIMIPRQMNTIKISIHEELPDSEEGDIIDDDDGNDDNDYDNESEYDDHGEDNNSNGEDADKGGSKGLDRSGDHHHHHHHNNNNNNNNNNEESIPETLETPDMSSREYLLRETKMVMARMCLEQERDFDRLLDELMKFYPSDS